MLAGAPQISPNRLGSFPRHIPALSGAADVGARLSFQPMNEAAMSGLIRKSLDTPEEIRLLEGGMGQVELVKLEGGADGWGTLQPG